MDVATFRSTFPVFAAEEAYPDAQVSFWLGIATQAVVAERWGTLADLGISLHAAHNLTLERAAGKTAAFGGAPAQNTGPLASKSVDKVAATYDTGAASIEGGGNWNLTTYGTRFLYYANMAGMGGFYVGAGDAYPYPGLSSPWAFLN